MSISIFKVLSVHQCVLQSKICVLLSSVTTITITNGKIPIKLGQTMHVQHAPSTFASSLAMRFNTGTLLFIWLCCYCFGKTSLMALPIRIHFLWNIYIKTKGRLLKIFNSIKYLTLVYIMAKNINYHIYKPQIIFPPLLSVYNYFFEFSHCLLPVSFSTSYRLKTPYTWPTLLVTNQSAGHQASK